eukprot:CAMPEP_0113603322 /NCGR_PEP_ID=MMETSP0017_2-20120614/1216_1 /TAXON_ID=2856 /ORGANISM="Cylindrotheca closterium" /LENGTH=74 /DNA_ID=CAMNT_0000511705 /DNA_START=44 /DNA_END=268 /DNA_ORIENTATION=+ /assembly_acc=CAM_ASM_000147
MADNKDADQNPHKRQVGNTGSPSKRSKREWLAYHGAKHTRVGDEFQVASLPEPETKEKGEDSKTEKGTKSEEST